MATKRSVSPSEAGRALKQTKLHFGSKMDSFPSKTAAKGSSKRQKPKRTSQAGESSKTTEETPEDHAKEDVSNSSSEDSANLSSPNPDTTNSLSKLKKIIITERVGDIFEDASDGTVLIHACNCIGTWGAGIALAFKRRYSRSFITYSRFCKSNQPDTLWGTALLIPFEKRGESRRHYVGCLFTSRSVGKAKDSPEEILAKTGPAMEDLIRQMAEIAKNDAITEIRMCRINSGLFAVPWEKTKAIIADLEVSGSDIPQEIIVYSPPEK